MDDYIKALQADKNRIFDYYKKSINKTEQQKFLEKILSEKGISNVSMNIADICCGGGTLSYHLSALYSNSKFTLLDYYDEGLKVAKQLNCNNKAFSYFLGDVYRLPFSDNCFDLIFCWQTLSWLEEPQRALKELIRISKPKGYIFISSLFNLDFDVDIYSKVLDHTRASSDENFFLNYNTYSKISIEKWLSDSVVDFEIVKFEPTIDFPYNRINRGLGTFTKRCENERLQISAGMLMNWGILVINS